MTKNKSILTSISIEEYLKAIWIVAQEGSATTNDLADHLGIAAPSVSAMLSKLQEQGLVSYTKYKGVSLSAQGLSQTLHLLRRHRLIETFLLEHLGYNWGEVHSEADHLEHAVSDTFTERLDAFLGHPSHDPHGDPIPNAEGHLPDTPNTPLAEVEVGQTLRVARLMSQAKDVLSYLSDLAICPGQQLKIAKREPLGGLVHITIAGKKEVLSKDLAMLIRGEVIA